MHPISTYLVDVRLCVFFWVCVCVSVSVSLCVCCGVVWGGLVWGGGVVGCGVGCGVWGGGCGVCVAVWGVECGVWGVGCGVVLLLLVVVVVLLVLLLLWCCVALRWVGLGWVWLGCVVLCACACACLGVLCVGVGAGVGVSVCANSVQLCAHVCVFVWFVYVCACTYLFWRNHGNQVGPSRFFFSCSHWFATFGKYVAKPSFYSVYILWYTIWFHSSLQDDKGCSVFIWETQPNRLVITR